MTNQTIITGTIGPSGKITVKMTFKESAVNAAAGTSTVTCVMQLTNTAVSTEYWYRYLDGWCHPRVNGVIKQYPADACYFDLKAGQTVTRTTMTWYGVPHASGSVAVEFAANWPTGAFGSISLTTGHTLTLNNAPAPPTPVNYPASNVVGPTGVGTQTFLNWLNMDNKAPGGNTIIAPYNNMYLQISQASYPDHFNPVLLLSDLGSQAFTGIGPKVTTGNSNYAVCNFWYTTNGPTLPSAVAFKTNVPNANVLTCKPPGNPPKTATGWGIAVSRTSGTANAANVTIQAMSGSPSIPLTSTFVASNFGITTTGGPPPASSFANNFAWSQNSVINLGNSPFPSTKTIATIGGYWYQFYLVTSNKAGASSSQPIIYFAPGTPPSTGGNTGGDSGNTNGVNAPAANIAVFPKALNSAAASCAVVPTVAQLIDFATPAVNLTPSATPATLINYCGDPRAYWLTASQAGNNTANPYVVESSAAGYTAHNAVALPQQMTYAMAALGLAEVDRGHQLTFVNATNNTGSQVSHYVYVGGNPDAGNTAASYPVPAGAANVQVSAMAWINSANTNTSRTVTPFSAIKFSAIYSNGVVAGTSTVALSAIPVNQLVQLNASYTLPASTSRVSAAFVANTASAGAWNGGYGAAESITTTGFMMLFNQQSDTPYFDGGFPAPPSQTYAIHTSADLATTVLSQIVNTRDYHGAGVP